MTSTSRSDPGARGNSIRLLTRPLKVSARFGDKEKSHSRRFFLRDHHCVCPSEQPTTRMSQSNNKNKKATTNQPKKQRKKRGKKEEKRGKNKEKKIKEEEEEEATTAKEKVASVI